MSVEDPVATATHEEPSRLPPLLTDAVVVLAVLAVVGLAAGVMWQQLVDPAKLVRFEDGVGQDELQLGHVFDSDAWYLLVALASGAVAGLVLSLWRRRNPLATVLLLVAGSLLAGWLMYQIGHSLGPDDPTARLQEAKVGTSAPSPLTLSATVGLLGRDVGVVGVGWPVGVLSGALLPLLFRRS